MLPILQLWLSDDRTLSNKPLDFYKPGFHDFFTKATAFEKFREPADLVTSSMH